MEGRKKERKKQGRSRIRRRRGVSGQDSGNQASSAATREGETAPKATQRERDSSLSQPLHLCHFCPFNLRVRGGGFFFFF